MSEKNAAYDIIGIGHAIMDVFVRVKDDNDLVLRGLPKGGMKLVTENDTLNFASDSAIFDPGGSVSNSLAVAASIGAKTGLLASVADDLTGALYVQQVSKGGVDYLSTHRLKSPATGRSVIHISPDGERTMATYLGAACAPNFADAMHEAIDDAKFLFFDGYMLGNPETRALVLSSIMQARLYGRTQIATSLGDAAFAGSHRDIFARLLDTGFIDILFANQKEIGSFVGAEDGDSKAATWRHNAVSKRTLFVTKGAAGSRCHANGWIIEMPCAKVDKVIDTTGAGDAFAGGVLYGLSHKLGLDQAMAIGTEAAGRIISQVSARPTTSLSDLAA